MYLNKRIESQIHVFLVANQHIRKSMPDPKIIGLLALSLLVGYGALSIVMDQVKEEYNSDDRLHDILRPFLPRAMYKN